MVGQDQKEHKVLQNDTKYRVRKVVCIVYVQGHAHICGVGATDTGWGTSKGC